MGNYIDKYKDWLNSDFIDAEDKKELESINNNEKEILLDDYNEIIKKVIININKKENLINIFEEINQKIVEIKSSGKKILNSYFINKELDKIIEIIGIENIYE